MGARSWSGLAAAMFCLGFCGLPQAIGADRLSWHTSYTVAQTEAREDGKLLCLLFEDLDRGEIADRMWSTWTSSETLNRALGDVVVARIPREATIPHDGKDTPLLQHAAFKHMRGRSGVAIVDYTRSESPHFGHVVSVYPRFPVPSQHMLDMLSLPEGSLSQRTLVLAVRMHPEHPRSTQGRFSRLLGREASSHSNYQASINVQGHQNFNSRFHRINAQLPGGLMVQEVVAESWPGQGLFDAAVECVSSWRQSSGHWSAVRSAHPYFAYDMKRGGNGVWYATGLFARP